MDMTTKWAAAVPWGWDGGSSDYYSEWTCLIMFYGGCSHLHCLRLNARFAVWLSKLVPSMYDLPISRARPS